jgi:hypothetical protein
MQIRKEIFACTRVCEYLLAYQLILTPDEQSLLEYYIRELAQRYHFKWVELPERADDGETIKN